MYLASSINERLRSNTSTFRRCKSQREVNSKLRKIFKDLNVKTKIIIDKSSTGSEPYLGGLYNSDRDEITLIFFLPPKARKVRMRTKNEMIYFHFTVSQVLQHELIHRYQYSNRKVKFEQIDYSELSSFLNHSETSLEYLLDYDEIEAYSHDIAMELKWFYPDKDILGIMRKIHKHRKNIWTYNMYYEAMKNTKYWKSTQRKLLKRAYQWLPTVEV